MRTFICGLMMLVLATTGCEEFQSSPIIKCKIIAKSKGNSESSTYVFQDPYVTVETEDGQRIFLEGDAWGEVGDTFMHKFDYYAGPHQYPGYRVSKK